MQSNAGIDDAHSNLNSAGKKKKRKKNDRHFECMQMSWVKSSA